MSGSAWAYDFMNRWAQNIGGTTYHYDMWYNITDATNHYVEVTFKDINYNSYHESTQIAIPETVTYNDVTYTVTAIGANAFRNCTILQYIYLSDVTSIGDNAFYGCTGLLNLTLTNKILTIGSNAFDGCTGLTSVTIPLQMTSIGQSAFRGCTNLTSVYYNATNCTMGSYIFDDCTHDCTLTIGDDVPGIPNGAFYYFPGLKTINFGTHADFYIGDGAFTSCTGLTSIVIPDNVTTIARFAFNGCTALTEVTIGAGVVSIGDTWGQTFNNCNNITTINYNATNCSDLSINQPLWLGCNHNCTVHIGDNVERLPKDIFRNLTNLKTIVYGSNPSLTEIGDNAFQNTGLTSVTIPNSVEIIGSSAFSNCSSLVSLDLGSVRIINSNAFGHCTSLKKLIIPTSVDEIHESGGANGAFCFCSGLEEIWFMGLKRPTIDSHVFDNVPTGIPVYVPKGYYNICSFTNYKYFLRFVGDNNLNNWMVASNWAGASTYTNTAAPTSDEVVVIDGSNDPFITGNITLRPYKIVLKNGRKIIIDGGNQYGVNELIYDEPIQVTVIKDIDAAADWTTTSDGWYFIASPINANLIPAEVEGLITNDDEILGHTFDLYRYNESAITYEGDHIPWQNYRNPLHHDGFRIQNGAGYLYANSSDATIEFTGVTKVFNTSAANTITLEYEGWNLIGNPFTFNVFPDCDLASLNHASAVTYEALDHYTVRPCEGFAVYGNAGDVVTLYRSTLASPAPSQNNSLNMVLTNANVRDAKPIDNVIVNFSEGNGMPKFEFGEQNAKLYIPQNGKDYAIVYSDEQGVLPLNFEANEIGVYTITVNTEDADLSYLHLIDNLTGADIDLLATPSYQFTGRKSDYASRFKLMFRTNGIEENTDGDESFAYYSDGQIVIAGVEDAFHATLQVIDVTGRVVLRSNGESIVSTAGMAPGVYTLQLIQNKQVKNQKIIIK